MSSSAKEFLSVDLFQPPEPHDGALQKLGLVKIEPQRVEQKPQ